MEAESLYHATVALDQSEFLKAHASCLEQREPSFREAEGSETSSSEAIETPAETKPTWITSSTLSFPANQDGGPKQSVLQDIVGWFNSHQIHGIELAVGIGVIRMLRATTPPSGLASPSTEEAVPAASGPAGDDEEDFGLRNQLDRIAHEGFSSGGWDEKAVGLALSRLLFPVRERTSR